MAAPRSEWSMGRYMRHLTTWLRENAGRFDVLFVDGIREEAAAAVEAARSIGCATILRCSGWGWERDTEWWNRNRSTARCGTVGKLADAVVAKSPECARALVAAGYQADRVVRIDDGIAGGPQPTTAMKVNARQSLATANGDLFAEEDVPIVLCTSSMTRSGGIHLLVDAARLLITRHPNLRLWFVGDGPYRDSIYQRIRGDGVRASIAMPGSFNDNEDLFLAADIFLQPDEHGLDYFLPAAVRAQLPIVAVDQPSIRTVLTGNASERGTPGEEDPGQWVQWLPGATSKIARKKLCDVLGDLPNARVGASKLRRHLLRSRPQTGSVQAYHELVRRVMNRPSGRNLSIEAAS
ncbi:MAG: glycosyltransferase family 4 protein [Planctomycetaceae bacterium]|nr:glycosyltransferase family 4 protein [Planctomycetaceae bacterium]